MIKSYFEENFKDIPLILGGDFNDEVESAPIDEMSE